MTIPAKRAAFYLRVSTSGQTTENQRQELMKVAKQRGWEVVEVFEDKGISVAKSREQRPALDRLMKAAVRAEFDVLMTWSVDRLGRSLHQLVTMMGEIDAMGVSLYLHQQALDTTTPAGKALLGMAAVFAEFERSMIVERVNAGLSRAKAQGTRSGKPIGRPRVGPEVEKTILRLRRRGMGLRAIAREVSVGVSVVQRVTRSASNAGV